MNPGMKLPVILSFLFFLLSRPVGVMAAGTAGSMAPDAVGILESQLRNPEVSEIRRAVDEALEEAGSLEISADRLLQDAVKGNPMANLRGLPSAVLTLLGKEVKGNVALMMELLAVMLLSALIKGLQAGGSGISHEAARMAISGVIVIIASVSFGGMVRIARGAIESMQVLASFAMPALYALLASSGQLVSAAAIQPLMLAGVNAACHIFKVVLLPLAVMAGILFLVDGLTERFRLKSLAKLFKSLAVWITSGITLIFTLGVTLQRLAGSSVDAAAVKTAKFAIGTLVPVAGKNMSDAAETLLACTNAVRNAAGIATVIALAIICLSPFLKILVIMLVYRLTAAFGAPLCQGGICDSLEDAAGCMMTIIGILGASLFVMILLTGVFMGGMGIPV